MAGKTIYEDWLADAEMARMLAQEKLIMSATEAICELIARENITRTELANRLGKTKGYISQVLGGSRNITLRTLADIIHSLGHSASIHIDQDGGKTKGKQFVEIWELQNNQDAYDKQSSDDYYCYQEQTPIDLEKIAI